MAPTKWLITVSSQSHVRSGDAHRSRSVGSDSLQLQDLFFRPFIHPERYFHIFIFYQASTFVCEGKLRPLSTTRGSNQLYQSTYRLQESSMKHNSKKNIFPDLLHQCKWTSSTSWSCCKCPCWQISVCTHSPGTCSFDKWGLLNGEIKHLKFFSPWMLPIIFECPRSD